MFMSGAKSEKLSWSWLHIMQVTYMYLEEEREDSVEAREGFSETAKNRVLQCY